MLNIHTFGHSLYEKKNIYRKLFVLYSSHDSVETVETDEDDE